MQLPRQIARRRLHNRNQAQLNDDAIDNLAHHGVNQFEASLYQI